MSETDVQRFMRNHPVSEWCRDFSPASMIIHDAIDDANKMGTKRKKKRGKLKKNRLY